MLLRQTGDGFPPGAELVAQSFLRDATQPCVAQAACRLVEHREGHTFLLGCRSS